MPENTLRTKFQLSIPYGKAKAMTDLCHPAPQLTTTDAENFSRKMFGIQASASKLDSERDCNFHFNANNDANWILTIVNASEPAIDSEFQAALLQHLLNVNPKLTVPRLKENVEENLIGICAMLVAHERIFITRFETLVLPKLPSLRTQVIHNDA